MEKVALKVEMREGTGKGPARRLRAVGKFPGVIYGQGKSIPVSINTKEFTRILHSGAGSATLLTVNVEGSKDGDKMAIIRDWQSDPIKGDILHVDLLEVAMDKAIKVTVPVVVTGGDPAGVKEGGMLHHLSRELEVECLPANIPDHVVVDASALKIGESIHVADLKLPEGIKAVTEPEHVIVSITAPITAEKLDQMLATETAAEVKEPEVLTKKKEEEVKEKEKK